MWRELGSSPFYSRVRKFCLRTKTIWGILLYTSTLNICHRFVSLMPIVSLIVFSFLLEMVEGIGTAMYRTATFTLLTQLYPDRKGLVAVSILSSVSICSYLRDSLITGTINCPELQNSQLIVLVIKPVPKVSQSLHAVLCCTTNCWSRTVGCLH